MLLRVSTQTALRTIHERASKANALASAVHTRAERWRDLGDDARAVEQLTAEVERLARELASNASAAALAVQLGGVLKRKVSCPPRGSAIST